MTAAAAWRTLRRQGGRLYLKHHALRCTAPTGTISPALRSALASQRRTLAHALEQWGPEAGYLVLWFIQEAPLSTEPFQRCPWIRVTDPMRFYSRLYADIQDGPTGPRARTGALQDDLRLLHEHTIFQMANQ